MNYGLDIQCVVIVVEFIMIGLIRHILFQYENNGTIPSKLVSNCLSFVENFAVGLGYKPQCYKISSNICTLLLRQRNRVL